jgi:hypothetical protein
MDQGHDDENISSKYWMYYAHSFRKRKGHRKRGKTTFTPLKSRAGSGDPIEVTVNVPVKISNSDFKML